jgi:GT2 family glycosyltransferase
LRTAVAIVTWNGRAHVGACLRAVAAQTACPDVVVVDNASADTTLAVVQSFEPRLRERGRTLRILPQPLNRGYTGGANVALRHILAAGGYGAILLVNQDATLDPDCIAQVTEVLARVPEAGIVGAKLLYPDGVTLQHAGGYLTRPRLEGRHHGQGERDDGRFDMERDVEFVTGAVLALRTACLEQVGVFDEVFSPGYYEDVDLCLRAHGAGWRIVYAPAARARHVESASFTDRLDRLRLTHRNRLVFAWPELRARASAFEFGAAEREAMPAEHTDVLRALALACLQVILEAPAIGRARTGNGPDPDTVRLVADLRTACLGELRRRRAAFLSPPC